MASPHDDSSRASAREGVVVAAALVVLGAGFGVAYAVDRRFVEAGIFAFAAVAAVAAVVAVLATRANGRRQQVTAADLRAVIERQRLALAETSVEQPEPRVLFLHEGVGVQRLRVERLRPRSLDLEQTVEHERTLALRTLPSSKANLGGSLRIYREPSEEDRSRFREQVDAYASALREALESYDVYRWEHAARVSGRFRIENPSRRPAHHLTVRAYFPEPFEVVRDTPALPAIPRRPTFHSKRAGLTALLGGETRPLEAADDTQRASGAVRRGDVSRPVYREGSAIVEVGVETVTRARPADMADADQWVLRLPRPGVYPIRWEILCDELDEPARGELWLEVVELLDDAPIRSVKELLGEGRADQTARGD